MSKIHLLSKSIPRSGHHYVVNLLSALYGSGFYYCEFYQPSAERCCKKTPCTKALESDHDGHPRYLVSMQKSHDFKIADKVYKPSNELKYLLFFRDFSEAIRSRTKLFLVSTYGQLLMQQGVNVYLLMEKHDKAIFRKSLAIIDAHAGELPKSEYEKFILDAAAHHVKFTQKWRAVAKAAAPHALVVDYDSLVSGSEKDLARQLIEFTGIEPACSVEDAIARCPIMTRADKNAEVSVKASSLLAEFSKEIAACAQMVQRLI